MELPADGAASQPAAMTSLSDEDVMRMVQETGDRRAFGLLVRRWQGPIGSLCARMMGDADRGRDLAQDVFARLLERSAAFRHDSRFGTFLRRVAVNACLDARRRAAVRAVQPLGGEQAHDGAPELAVFRREHAALVRAALDRLLAVTGAERGLILTVQDGVPRLQTACFRHLDEPDAPDDPAEAGESMAPSPSEDSSLSPSSDPSPGS